LEGGFVVLGGGGFLPVAGVPAAVTGLAAAAGVPDAGVPDAGVAAFLAVKLFFEDCLFSPPL
jgi:hypothetical protein